MLIDMKEVIYSPLSSTHTYRAYMSDEKTCIAQDEAGSSTALQIRVEENKLTVQSEDPESEATLVGLEYILGHNTELTQIILNHKSFDRSEFFQHPQLWHHTKAYTFTPEKWITTNGKTHPLRAPHHQGFHYRRYIPHLGKTITFRLTNIETDLVTFHQWHNQHRVSFFWELNKPIEELKEYMTKGHQDPHQIPLVVEIDGEMVGYYEMYWVKEDRLGPYYDSDAFDRGFHFLIGNKKFLGYNITDSIIKSGLHLLFLDDARTRKIMAEPRSDNQKVLKYAEASVGWTKLKEFDFPHKRAALLENRREIFFGGNAL